MTWYTGPEKLALRQWGKIPIRLLILVGPSGVGKGTITERLLAEVPFLHRASTYTTRKPRPGEIEKGQYRFVSEEEFWEKVRSGEIMEHTEVYGTGTLYGMPADLIENVPPGKHVVLAEVDPNGRRFLIERYPKRCFSVFITAPPDVLIERIRHRAGQEGSDEDELRARLTTARQQVKEAGTYDYIVFNEEGRLDETVEAIKAIILAERHRPFPGLDMTSDFDRPGVYSSTT